MRRLRTAVAFCLATVCGVLPVDASAQNIPSSYRHIEPVQAVSLFGGYLATDRGELGLGMGSAPILGLQYTGRFAAPVAGVARVWTAPSDRTIYSRANASDPAAELTEIGTASSLVLGAEAGLRLLVTGPRTWNSLAPWIEATGGLITVAGSRTEEEQELPSSQVVDFGPAFAVGMAAGTDWFLTDRISTNLSFRGLLWRFSIPEGLSTTGSEETEWTRNFGVSIGAAFHF